MIKTPIIEVDVHGLTADQAVDKVEKLILKADSGTYRIRVIHGFNRGNAIQRAIYRDLNPNMIAKVKRLVGGDNPGVTEVVLKEY